MGVGELEGAYLYCGPGPASTYPGPSVHPEIRHGPRLGLHLWIPQGVRPASSKFFRNPGFRLFRFFGLDLRIRPLAEAGAWSRACSNGRTMPVPIFGGLGLSDPKLWPLKKFDFCRNSVYRY